MKSKIPGWGRYQVVLISLALFAAGLALRLPGVDRYLTPDEHLWSRRTAQFMTALAQHDWAATTTSGHPGITTTWLGSAGVLAKWVLARPADAPTLRALVAGLEADPTRLDMLPWLRLPVAVFCALGTVAIYGLARRLLGGFVALLAAAFLLLDPFWLAHGKIIHLDGVLSVLLSIAWLALLVAQKTRLRRYYLVSGLAIGAGVLTKSPALVLLPLVAAAVLLDRWRIAPSRRAAARDAALDGLWLGLPALGVMLALWPALWTAPVSMVGRVLDLMLHFAETPHESGNFWLGRPVDSPGALFYPAALLWRTTPVTLVGLVLAAGISARTALGSVRRQVADPRQGAGSPSAAPDQRASWALWAYVLWFGIILSLGSKKFDRYLLPVFAACDVLAAWAWARVLSNIPAKGQRFAFCSPRGVEATAPLGVPACGVAATRRSGLLRGGAALLVAAQSFGVWAERPSYLTAYNPLAGGIRVAQQVMLVGWGEGLSEAAAYLNSQEGANTKRAMSWYAHNCFAPFFRGQAYDFPMDGSGAAFLYRNDMDYVVTYLNQVQRGSLDANIQEQLDEPLFDVLDQGVRLAQVYRWPKPFDHTTERSLGGGLSLLGWDLGPHNPATGEVPLTLYWDQAVLSQAASPDMRIVAWMKDGAGDVWAEAEGPISNGLAASRPGWLGQTVTVQNLTLTAPLGLLPGAYRVEIAPTAGESFALTEVDARPVRIQDLGQQGAQSRDWTPLPEIVRFGEQLQLLGYNREASAAETVIDLVWLVEDPRLGAESAPNLGLKSFVHVVDGGNQIVAQHDGCLAGPDCQAETAWQPGQLVRQRVHLPIDLGARQDLRVYVGTYDPASGRRLPATADDQALPDGRYELTGADSGSG